MTVPRRMTVLCRDAKVLLEAAGYDVVIVPERSLQQRFLAHLIAFDGNADMRYIWIKIAIQPFVCLADVEMHCSRESGEIRKRLARYPQQANFHGEIWVATADGRFHCYEVSADAIRAIFKGKRAPIVRMEGAAT